MVNVAVFASGSGTNFENLVVTRMQYARIALLVVDKDNIGAIEKAIRLDIPYVYVNPKAFASKKEYEEKIISYLQAYEIECIALAGYMRIVSDVLLQAFPKRIINIHPAYLPNFPGAHGIQDAFEANAKETGVTIHYVDAGIDTGEIIAQEKLTIQENWDLATLEQHVHELEYMLYPVVLDGLCQEGL